MITDPACHMDFRGSLRSSSKRVPNNPSSNGVRLISSHLQGPNGFSNSLQVVPSTTVLTDTWAPPTLQYGPTPTTPIHGNPGSAHHRSDIHWRIAQGNAAVKDDPNQVGQGAQWLE